MPYCRLFCHTPAAAESEVIIVTTLYHPSIHDTAVLADSHWVETAGPPPDGTRKMNGDHTCEVAVIGAGYTGLSAALHLARQGVDVRVVDGGLPGGGASGRNGGFCCVGAAMLPDQAMIRRFGQEETRRFYQSQRDAVSMVSDFVKSEKMSVDLQGDGVLSVAHRQSRVEKLRAAAAFNTDSLGLPCRFLEREALAEKGFAGKEAHAALHFADGFGLHPLKYHYGLLNAVLQAGVPVHTMTRVIGWKVIGGRHRLITQGGSVHARQVLLATNGYTGDDLHPGLDGAVLPVISSIVTTEPLKPSERETLGWTTDTPISDTRNLLTYIRILPDGRLLLGTRGETSGAPGGEERARERIANWFHAMFPNWNLPKISHSWSGLICLSANQTPMIGQFPDHPGVFHALAYHGNGVATGTWAGWAAAEIIAGDRSANEILPEVVARPPRRFLMPGLRRWYLKMAYAGHGLRDLI